VVRNTTRDTRHGSHQGAFFCFAARFKGGARNGRIRRGWYFVQRDWKREGSLRKRTPRATGRQGSMANGRVGPIRILYEIPTRGIPSCCTHAPKEPSRYQYSGRTSNGLSRYLHGRHSQNWSHPHHGGIRSRPSGNSNAIQYLIPCIRYPMYHDIHGASLGSHTIIMPAHR
jgi:hypothetical protein